MTASGVHRKRGMTKPSQALISVAVWLTASSCGAPDIDTTSFRRSLAPALTASARRVTIYASQRDRALDLAQRASSYPRVGQAGPGLLVLPGLDVIDASAAEEGEFGHGYLGASNAVLADLRAVLAGVPVATRRVERRQRAGLVYWELLGEAR